jgi:hypothetical protein
MSSPADFRGCVTRLAARFDPPVVAFEYRPAPGARRLVHELAVPELADASAPFAPAAAAEALLSRDAPCWPFAVHRISHQQLARLLGRIREHWVSRAVEHLASSANTDAAACPTPFQPDRRPACAALPEAEAAYSASPPCAQPPAPTPCLLPRFSVASSVGLGTFDETMDQPEEAPNARPAPLQASPEATKPLYRVTSQQRARAHRRYAKANRAGAHNRYGAPPQHDELDLQLSASTGLVTRMWAGLDRDDEASIGGGASDADMDLECGDCGDSSGEFAW